MRKKNPIKNENRNVKVADLLKSELFPFYRQFLRHSLHLLRLQFLRIHIHIRYHSYYHHRPLDLLSLPSLYTFMFSVQCI